MPTMLIWFMDGPSSLDAVGAPCTSRRVAYSSWHRGDGSIPFPTKPVSAPRLGARQDYPVGAGLCPANGAAGASDNATKASVYQEPCRTCCFSGGWVRQAVLRLRRRFRCVANGVRLLLRGVGARASRCRRRAL